MYNRMMSKKEQNVKVGDHVWVMGNRGVVTEVFRGRDIVWNEEARQYEEVEGSDWTHVRVHFEGELASWGQYQDGTYGGYTVE